MKEIALNSGGKGFILKVEFAFTKDMVVTAITDYYFKNNHSTPIEELAKRDVEKILRLQFKMFGVQGQYHDSSFEDTATEQGRQYGDVRKMAKAWVDKHYC